MPARSSRKPITKAIFLEELKERSAKAISRDYGLNPGRLIRWRKEDKEFDHQVKLILQTPGRRKMLLAKGRGENAPKPTVTRASKKRVFLNKFRQQLRRVEAADFANVGMAELLSWMNPEHPDYDADFHFEYGEVEIRKALLAEDELIDKAIDGSVAAARVVLPKLPHTADRYADKKEPQLVVDKAVIVSREALGGTIDMLKQLKG